LSVIGIDPNNGLTICGNKQNNFIVWFYFASGSKEPQYAFWNSNEKYPIRRDAPFDKPGMAGIGCSIDKIDKNRINIYVANIEQVGVTGEYLIKFARETIFFQTN